MSNEEIVKLIKDNIDTKANYEQLYKQNKGFISLIIRRFLRHDQTIIDIDDMLQQAFIGLVSAVNAYDETKGKFTTILYWHIIQSLQQFLGYHSNISRDMKEKIKKYNEVCKDKVLTDDGIMEEMKINRQQLFYIRHCMNVEVSLDEKLTDDEFTRLDVLEDKSVENTQERLEQEELRNILNEFVEELPERPKTVIDSRYFRNKTINEIAEEMNVTSTNIIRIEKQGLNKLKRNANLKRKLEDYVNPYVQIGVKSFQRTRTSSVELTVLNAERYTQNWWEEYQ